MPRTSQGSHVLAVFAMTKGIVIVPWSESQDITIKEYPLDTTQKE